jgi:hypothetical protein
VADQLLMMNLGKWRRPLLPHAMGATINAALASYSRLTRAFVKSWEACLSAVGDTYYRGFPRGSVYR